MIIALFPIEYFKDSFKIAGEIATFLQKKDVTVVAERDVAKKISVTPIEEIDPQKIDIMVSMGGDGTILRLYNKYLGLPGAIFGINLGHLGFMAEIPIEELFDALDDLVSKRYKVDERLVLEGKSQDGRVFHAVNDIVIHRSHNQSLIELSLHVDGTYMNTFTADGLIIATPNGSTAYSLAAGGPILSPTIDAFVITPICAHTISNRPFVLTSNHTVEIKYVGEHDPIEVRADGLDHTTMKKGDSFHISKSKHRFRKVTLERNDYFKTLRSKLGWSGAATKRH